MTHNDREQARPGVAAYAAEGCVPLERPSVILYDRWYQIDLRLNLYGCPADAAEGIEDCTLAMDLLVSPNVDLEPGETVAFTGNA